MKISKQTTHLLKNFAAINDNIYLEPGNLLMTKSVANNITAEVEVAEKFPTAFGIYALNEFLGVLSLFQDPDLTFTEKYVTIAEGKNKVKYFGADKSILAIPKKRMSFDLVNAEADVSFKLSADQLQQIIKTSGVLRAPDVLFVGNGKTLIAMISDVANVSSNSYSMELCESKSHCSVHFRVENLKMVTGDYDVDLSKANISRFTNGSLVYHIAIEADSTFE